MENTSDKEYCKESDPNLSFDAKSRSCIYSTKYVDRTGSRGTLAKEKLTFDTIYGKSFSASLNDVLFGCGHDNYGEPVLGTGVLGLGYGENSLVKRLDSKFSYCFGSLDDPSYKDNVLTIGDNGANLLGDTTPLKIKNGLYFITIESICVDGILLPIGPWVFQSRSSGTVTDTRTLFTMLIREVYEPLKEKIDDIFDVKYIKTGKGIIECYKGDLEQDLVNSGFPTVTFQFTNGAELSLDAKSMFLKLRPDWFCLAVTPTVSSNLNIIGTAAQQNYNIGYDLEAKQVSFERIDCALLFED